MSKQNFYLQLKQEEKELLETINALQVLIKRYEVENPVQAHPVAFIPDATTLFDRHKIETASKVLIPLKQNASPIYLSIPKKVVLALGAIKSGTSREVGIKLHELYPFKSETEAIDNARYYLSKLYNEKKLILLDSKDGKRGHVYALPETT